MERPNNIGRPSQLKLSLFLVIVSRQRDLSARGMGPKVTTKSAFRPQRTIIVTLYLNLDCPNKFTNIKAYLFKY